ncbi:MAG TPA: hypothetical protein VF407_21565 [Polyangiaceae bacterium]
MWVFVSQIERRSPVGKSVVQPAPNDRFELPILHILIRSPAQLENAACGAVKKVASARVLRKVARLGEADDRDTREEPSSHALLGVGGGGTSDLLGEPRERPPRTLARGVVSHGPSSPRERARHSSGSLPRAPNEDRERPGLRHVAGLSEHRARARELRTCRGKIGAHERGAFVGQTLGFGFETDHGDEKRMRVNV